MNPKKLSVFESEEFPFDCELGLPDRTGYTKIKACLNQFNEKLLPNGTKKGGLLVVMLISIYFNAFAQNPKPDSVPSFTLQQCIDYAMEHQPGLNQNLNNLSIAKITNHINLSGWLPQVTISGSLIHYETLPTALVTNPLPGGPPIPTKTGVVNTATPELSASETIFSPQVLYAARSASIYINQAKQGIDSAQIGIVAVVSKSFYNLLLTLIQINVLKEDTARLARNMVDTYHQYKGGIVDKTDYQEAVVSFNNSKGQLIQQLADVVPLYASLKQLIGYPYNQHFNVVFDTAQMLKEIAFDTTIALQYEKRIEYQELETEKSLQHEQTDYYKLSSLPTLSAFYNYYYEYENNTFSDLFTTAYPYSYVGLSINIPIFTGLSHFEYVNRSKLIEKNLEWAETNLQAGIYTEYESALANYKGSLANWKLLKDNVAQSRSLYNVVTLQYKQGIVAYLNVIVAESNLITAETGYINAMFQLLTSKIDLEKAMGVIPYKSLTH